MLSTCLAAFLSFACSEAPSARVVGFTGALRTTPTAWTISPADPAVEVGSTIGLSVPPVGKYEVRWSSEQSAVATVDSRGTVTGIAVGTAIIRASAGPNRTATNVTVVAAAGAVISAVTITPSQASLAPGATAQLQAQAYDGGTPVLGVPFTWSSSAPAVATVSASGLVTAVTAGTATITAITGGTAGTASITVTAPPPAPVLAMVVISPDSARVPVDGTVELDATGQAADGTVIPGLFTWSSSSPAVATVSVDGLVRGVTPGVAVFTASSGGVSDQATVTVTAPAPPTVVSVLVTPVTAQLSPGGSAQFSAAARDASGGAIAGETFTWASSNPAVASVSVTGMVTATAGGTASITATAANGVAGSAAVTVSGGQLVEVPPAVPGIWIGTAELNRLPTSGAAWDGVKAMADSDCGTPDLANQDQDNNVCIMAKALAYARTGTVRYRQDVTAALRSIVQSGPYTGRALALGRELAAYVIAADLVALRVTDPALDQQFRARLAVLRTTPTIDGPANLVQCHEQRPNNWGTHCGASRIAIDAYLGDGVDLKRAADVVLGWLGNRASYAGFKYGELMWQCDPAAPVGINPAGCQIQGYPVDGVLPDDQRRAAGGFTWPPQKENYVYEALQGALAEAQLLSRQGVDAWHASNDALKRAFVWLHSYANFPASGDDRWQPHLVNRIYGTSFPAPLPSQPGKNVGWTEWTHQ